MEEKEKIQILLAEYNTLRSEINSRISSIYGAVGVVIFLVSFILQQNMGPSFFVGIFIAVVGAGVCGRFLAHDTFVAARRVREIEEQINAWAGEKLLVWESERGGLNGSRWRESLSLALLKFANKSK